jgi:hypothetical protein
VNAEAIAEELQLRLKMMTKAKMMLSSRGKDYLVPNDLY